MLIFKKRFRLPPTHMIIALAIVDSSFICDVMTFQQKRERKAIAMKSPQFVSDVGLAAENLRAMFCFIFFRTPPARHLNQKSALKIRLRGDRK